VRVIVDGLAIGDMHHYWWKSVEVRGNWKVAQEAFFETYYVPTTHPQLDDAGRDFMYEGIHHDVFQHFHVQYDAFQYGHSRFYAG
jgi:phenylpropionate dioxygenase-like ring-hydroxylating dioxygenase large terminal subunit